MAVYAHGGTKFATFDEIVVERFADPLKSAVAIAVDLNVGHRDSLQARYLGLEQLFKTIVLYDRSKRLINAWVNDLTDTILRDASARSDTAERIMDAAEELFGDVGFSATSVRDVAARAKTSPGSINYYFGSKDGLIRAVIKRVSEPVTRTRMSRMASLEAEYGDAPIPLPEILRSFLEPLFVDGGAGRHKSISRLLTQVTVTTDPKIGAIWTEFLGPTGRTYVDALQKTLDHLSPAEVFLRYQFFLLSTYDTRAFTGWYRDWAKSEFGLEISDVTIDQRIALFQDMFTADDHVPLVA